MPESQSSEPRRCHTAITASEEETLSLGAALASLLDVGDVVALDGDLGVGKTRLSAGIAGELGAHRDDVTSPTFTLIHEYATEPPLAHIDAYRLADSDEFLALGVSELWDEGIVIVEWGCRVQDALPRDTLFIQGVAINAKTRSWELSANEGWTPRWADIQRL